MRLPGLRLRCSAALLAVPGTAGCDAACGNAERARVGSPDGRWDAVVFTRQCGASTAPSTEVAVVRRGVMPDGGGNAFVAGGDPDVAVWWDGPAALTVRHAPGEVVVREPDVSGVRVTFLAAERAASGVDRSEGPPAR
jgi:hypothetical protein